MRKIELFSSVSCVLKIFIVKDDIDTDCDIDTECARFVMLDIAFVFSVNSTQYELIFMLYG